MFAGDAVNLAAINQVGHGGVDQGAEFLVAEREQEGAVAHSDRVAHHLDGAGITLEELIHGISQIEAHIRLATSHNQHEVTGYAELANIHALRLRKVVGG